MTYILKLYVDCLNYLFIETVPPSMYTNSQSIWLNSGGPAGQKSM